MTLLLMGVTGCNSNSEKETTEANEINPGPESAENNTLNSIPFLTSTIKGKGIWYYKIIRMMPGLGISKSWNGEKGNLKQINNNWNYPLNQKNKMTKFSRKDFLKTAAVSATAAILPGVSVAAEKQDKAPSLNPNPLKLGLMTYNIGKDWDIATIIKNCSETGFKHVELRTTHKHGVEVSLNKQQRDEVKKRFEDSPLEAISLASAFAYHHPDQNELKSHIEGTKEYLQLAADIGAQGIRVFPNALPDGIDPEKTMEQIGKSVAEVGLVGHNLGVDVRLEEHGRGTDNIPVIKKIIDYSESPHVYVLWNSSPNDVLGEGLEANFNMVKDRISCVHLRELFNGYPWREFFALLSKSGYKGYLDAELSDQSCEPIRMMHNYQALFLALQNAI
jgi:sugar phosphate isomerase/epimerase